MMVVLLQVTTLAAALLAHPPVGSWQHHTGSISATVENLAVHNDTTVEDAERFCEATAGCAGFTFEANVSLPASPVKVYFKNQLASNTDPSWQTFYRQTVDMNACPSVRLVWEPSFTQINASSAGPKNMSDPTRGPAAPGNRGGLEDGIVVRRADGKLSMVAAEMYAGGWVQMRLGVWESLDGLSWSRQRSLRASTGRDNSGPHAASWGPFFVHDPTNDTWALSYVAYRSAGSNNSGW
jgi:hypothetical protein